MYFCFDCRIHHINRCWVDIESNQTNYDIEALKIISIREMNEINEMKDWTKVSKKKKSKRLSK